MVDGVVIFYLFFYFVVVVGVGGNLCEVGYDEYLLGVGELGKLFGYCNCCCVVDVCVYFVKDDVGGVGVEYCVDC